MSSMTFSTTTGTAPKSALQAKLGWLGNSFADRQPALEQETCRTPAVHCPAAAMSMLNDAIRGSEESEFRQFSMALMAMQEIERKRIASDLHDSIGQSLSALSCGIVAALEGTGKGHAESSRLLLQRLATQVKDAIVEVQRIAMNLRPALLDDIGLIETLSWFFREFSLSHPAQTLHPDINVEEHEIPETLRTHVFRVIQEAMNNVVKHSRADTVRVRLLRVESEIHLEVFDNGSGFTAETVRQSVLSGSGMGLRGMRERAECSGGRFCLLSSPGKGTRILIVWPILKQLEKESSQSTLSYLNQQGTRA